MTLLPESRAFSWGAFLGDTRVEFDTRLDIWESFVSSLPPSDFPLVHKFPPGLYVREITMPAGAIITSRIHKYESPFIISKGRVMVVSENEGTVIYDAPHSGITKPETRRLLVVLEDSVWTTFHANPENITDVDTVTDMFTYQKHNPYLED